jgi:hypothetical protein
LLLLADSADAAEEEEEALETVAPLLVSEGVDVVDVETSKSLDSYTIRNPYALMPCAPLIVTPIVLLSDVTNKTVASSPALQVHCIETQGPLRDPGSETHQSSMSSRTGQHVTVVVSPLDRVQSSCAV